MPPNPKNGCLHATVNRLTGCCERCKQFVGFPFAGTESTRKWNELNKMVREANAKPADADVQPRAMTTTEKPKIEWRLAPGFHWDEYGNCVKEE